MVYLEKFNSFNDPQNENWELIRKFIEGPATGFGSFSATEKWYFVTVLIQFHGCLRLQCFNFVQYPVVAAPRRFEV